MPHNWTVVWLSEDLEGFRCDICGAETLDDPTVFEAPCKSDDEPEKPPRFLIRKLGLTVEELFNKPRFRAYCVSMYEKGVVFTYANGQEIMWPNGKFEDLQDGLSAEEEYFLQLGKLGSFQLSFDREVL